jgi:hypothetical protein
MLDYLDQRNHNPKPFIWTADGDLIPGEVERLCKLFPLRELVTFQCHFHAASRWCRAIGGLGYLEPLASFVDFHFVADA